MNADRWTRLNELVADVLEARPRDRDALLKAEPDHELRDEARGLVRAHAAAEAAQALDSPFQAPPLPGAVGPWTPTARLGAGGMGVVYAAERAGDGFLQRAALKLVRPGFGPDFRDRFFRERALLAGLDHPGVARLLDGGMTADGLPYLAMELVEGEPVTAYCEARDLALRARLALFLQACDAVAHAHRHLVVHRDLKPAHILVTEADGEPRVKLLDFGIGKLLDGSDDGLTRASSSGPLTPQYASPEQLAGVDVTTATDVYSLSVILYELLAGRRPYDVSGLDPSQAWRVVAETVPIRPSANGSGSTDTRRLRGDLDTVVLKGLAKEPERRYSSVEALADDVQRFLDGLPVKAQADNWAYRSGKFLRRHQTAVAAGAFALAAIVGGAGVAVWQAREASDQADRAEAAQDFLVAMLGAADPLADGRDVRVVDLLDAAAAKLDTSFANRPILRADLHDRLGETYYALGLVEAASTQYERALALYERVDGSRALSTARAQRELATMRRDLADYGSADSLYALSLATTQRALGGDAPETAVVLAELANLRLITGDAKGAEQAYRRVLEIEQATLAPDDPELLVSFGNLAVALGGAGDYAEAATLVERQVALYRRYHPDRKAALGAALANLGAFYARLDRYNDAVRVQTEAVELSRADLGNEHPDVAFALSNLGSSLGSLGRHRDAERVLRESASIYRATVGRLHPDVGYPLVNLAKSLRDLGRLAEAERVAGEAETLFRDGLGADHPSVARATEVRASIQRLRMSGSRDRSNGAAR